MPSTARTARRAALASAIAGAALAAGLPSAAHAATLTYVGAGGDTVEQFDTATGQSRTALPEKAGYDWHLPTADDQGRIGAIYQQPHEAYASGLFELFDAQGGSLSTVDLPVDSDGPGREDLPLSMELSPDGSKLLYAYNYVPPIGASGPTEPHLGVIDPLDPGELLDDAVKPEGDIAGARDAAWLGGRVVVSDHRQVFVGTPGSQDVKGWLSTELGLTGGRPSRDGSRVLVRSGGSGGSEELLLVQMGPGEAPASQPETACSIPTEGIDRNGPRGGDDRNLAAATFALSPDGREVAWGDAQGVHLASVPEVGATNDSDACVLQGARVVDADGREPSFSQTPSAPVAPTQPGPGTDAGPAPGGRPGPGTAPGTGTGGGATPAPGGRAPSSGSGGPAAAGGGRGSAAPAGSGAGGTSTGRVPAAGGRLVVGAATQRLALLRRGRASIRLEVGGPATVRVRLSSGRTTIAAGTARATAPGRVTVRLPRASRRALSALRGRRAVLVTATATAPGAERLEASRTLRLR